MLQRLKTLVIDDEDNNLHSIVELLRGSNEAKEILYVHSEVGNHREALNIIKEESFRLTIIDYRLDGIDCFAWLQMVDISRLGIIAITTTKEDEYYKRQSFKYGHELQCLSFPNCFSANGIKDFLSDLSDRLGKKYSVQYLQNKIELTDSEITHIETAGEYIGYYFRKSPNERIHKALSLTKSKMLLIESELNPNIFIRCHKSYFVNVNCIVGHCKKKKNPGGWLLTNIQMQDGTFALISYSKNAEDTLNKFDKLSNLTKVTYSRLILADYTIFE